MPTRSHNPSCDSSRNYFGCGKWASPDGRQTVRELLQAATENRTEGASDTPPTRQVGTRIRPMTRTARKSPHSARRFGNQGRSMKPHLPDAPPAAHPRFRRARGQSQPAQVGPCPRLTIRLAHPHRGPSSPWSTEKPSGLDTAGGCSSSTALVGICRTGSYVDFAPQVSAQDTDTEALNGNWQPLTARRNNRWTPELQKVHQAAGMPPAVKPRKG